MPYNARDYYDLDFGERLWTDVRKDSSGNVLSANMSLYIYGELQSSGWVIVRTYNYGEWGSPIGQDLRRWASNGGLEVGYKVGDEYRVIPIGSSAMNIGDEWLAGGHFWRLIDARSVYVYCIENGQWIWKYYPNCIGLLEILAINTPNEQVQNLWFNKGGGKVLVQRFKDRTCREIDFELHATIL